MRSRRGGDRNAARASELASKDVMNNDRMSDALISDSFFFVWCLLVCVRRESSSRPFNRRRGNGLPQSRPPSVLLVLPFFVGLSFLGGVFRFAATEGPPPEYACCCRCC